MSKDQAIEPDEPDEEPVELDEREAALLNIDRLRRVLGGRG
jgi:hypothetical protein